LNLEKFAVAEMTYNSVTVQFDRSHNDFLLVYLVPLTRYCHLLMN